MNFDPAEWGPPVAVILTGALLGALFLRGRGGADAAVVAEGKRDDLEANRAAAVDALRQLDLDKDKLDPEVYRREREALLGRGAAALRTLETEAPAAPAADGNTLIDRLRTARLAAGSEAFLQAVRVVAPELSARPGIAPEWKGAGFATLACALIAVLAWMATSESVDRREGASMTGNQSLGGGGQQAVPPELKQAITDQEARVTADPSNLTLLNDLTQLYLQAGDASKAMEQNRKVMELDPKNVDGRIYRGFLAVTVGMNDKALAEFDGVLAEQPAHPRALFYRALVLLEMDRKPEAIEALEAALAVQPGNPTLTRLLAQARGGGGPAPAAPAGPAEVLAEGTATLDPAFAAKVSSAQAVWVSLKDPAGGPPLGAVKLAPGPFPMHFEITTANLIAMGGAGRPVPATVNFAMWLDQDGSPMTRDEPIATVEGLAKGSTGLTLELTGAK
jgi:tetratricopeptide (TPR) repeat protein